MKKFLIGCSIVLLLAIAIATGILIFIGLKIKGVANNYEMAFQNMEQLETKYPYTKPGTRKLDEDRLLAYFEIREGFITNIQEDPLIKAFLEAEKDPNTAPPEVGLGDMWRIGSEAIPSWVEEFNTLSDSRQMPPSEYIFHLRTVYQTIYEGQERGDPDMTRIYSQLTDMVDNMNREIAKQNNPDLRPVQLEQSLEDIESMDEDSIAHNITLLKDHLDKIEDRPMLGGIEVFIYFTYEAQVMQGNAPQFGGQGNVSEAEATQFEGSVSEAEPIPAN